MTEELPTLIGSEKQIALANDLRTTALENFDAWSAALNERTDRFPPDQAAYYRSVLTRKTDAQEWIKLRGLRLHRLIRYFMTAEEKAVRPYDEVRYLVSPPQNWS